MTPAARSTVEALGDLHAAPAKGPWVPPSADSALRARLTPEAKHLIDVELPKWFDELEANIGPLPTSGLKHNLEHRMTVAETLLRNESRFDTTAPTLGRVGFAEAELENGKRGIVPTLSLREIYRLAYTELLGGVQVGREDPAMLPALSLERPLLQKTQRFGETRTTVKHEYLLLRPGLDPVPAQSERWRLPAAGAVSELPPPVFIENMAAGKVPLEMAMLHHDSLHLADLLEDKSYGRELRRYFQARHAANLQGPVAMHLLAADNYLLEFHFLTKPGSGRDLDAVFGPGPSKLTPEKLHAKYDALTPEQIAARVAALDAKYFKVFRGSGGGARDEAVRRSELADTLETVARSLGKAPQPFENHFYAYAKDAAPGILARLKVLGSLHRDAVNGGAPPVSEATTRLLELGLRLDDPSLVTGLRAQLTQQLALLEYQTRLGAKLEVSPSQSLEDLGALLRTRDLATYRASPTYAYYAQAFPPDSRQSFAFVKLAE